jgi:hypothetical protein
MVAGQAEPGAKRAKTSQESQIPADLAGAQGDNASTMSQIMGNEDDSEEASKRRCKETEKVGAEFADLKSPDTLTSQSARLVLDSLPPHSCPQLIRNDRV